MVNLALTRETNVHIQPSGKINQTLRSEQVLKAFVEVVRKNLPLELKKTRITSEDIIHALAYTNVHRLSIESACQEVQDAPVYRRCLWMPCQIEPICKAL